MRKKQNQVLLLLLHGCTAAGGTIAWTRSSRSSCTRFGLYMYSSHGSSAAPLASSCTRVLRQCVLRQHMCAAAITVSCWLSDSRAIPSAPVKPGCSGVIATVWLGMMLDRLVCHYAGIGRYVVCVCLCTPLRAASFFVLFCVTLNCCRCCCSSGAFCCV